MTSTYTVDEFGNDFSVEKLREFEVDRADEADDEASDDLDYDYADDCADDDDQNDDVVTMRRGLLQRTEAGV